MEQQGVAVDQASQPPQGVGSDGKPVVKKYRVTFDVTQVSARNLARAAALVGEQSTANDISKQIGEGDVKTSVFARHPYLTGTAVGLGIAGAGFGIFKGVQAYRRKKAEALQTGPGGRVIRMAK